MPFELCSRQRAPHGRYAAHLGREGQLRETKQSEILDSQVHLVEIDLLRSGAHTTAVPHDRLAAKAGEIIQWLVPGRYWDFRDIVLNGGIDSLSEARTHLAHVDGVMLGRAAYHNPYLLAAVDREFFDHHAAIPGREAIVARMRPYIERELQRGTALKHITRHMLGLYQGVPGARAWRRHLSTHAVRPGADATVVEQAREAVARQSAGKAVTSTGLHKHG